MDCLPLNVISGGSHHPYIMASNNTVNVTVASTTLTPGYGAHHSHTLNMDHSTHLLRHHHQHSHIPPYINNYALHHPVSGHGPHHHHIHSEQTKSLQELQHEVGALLEFRDLVIETFPDLKQKMASMSSAASNISNSAGANGIGSGLGNNGQSVGSVISAAGSTVTLTSNSTLVSRREWEPGIRMKRKVSLQKEQTTQPAGTTELTSTSLIRSRSNSQSGKKEPKNNAGNGSGSVASGVSGTSGVGGEHNNGSVIQDSGFSTETTSSKEGHSASSTNGALTGAIASNRLSCLESDDELLNLLDVIHRKSNRLREEVEHLQNYERQQFQQNSTHSTHSTEQLDMTERDGAIALSKSSSASSANTALTPKTFREHIERLNKEDIKQLRKERDRLLDKLAEMEAETLTGRIKAAKMNDQVEELINVKKELEEQLKVAMAQKLELSSRIQQIQQQQQQQQCSKISNSQSVNASSQRCLLNSSNITTDVIGLQSSSSSQVVNLMRSKHETFQPITISDNQQQQQQAATIKTQTFSSNRENSHHQQQLIASHQSIGSDTKRSQQQEQELEQQRQITVEQLGRLDGVVSTPGLHNTKCRLIDSKRFAAILLENNVIELQRHLLTLTVQNQVLMQKLDQANKSKSHLVKNLDKSKEDVEDLRFQLEEKNIELEGTKAQLRVLETRLHSSTPLSGMMMMPSNNSYLLHSHQDYETNRSSNSTTLIMSRREGGVTGGNEYRRSTTPTKNMEYMPQPNTTQISTPSMKAMIHLPMDELQQNSSSTESAHDPDEQQQPLSGIKNRNKDAANIMSISVGGISPFEQQQHQQQQQQQQQQINALRNQVQALKKFSGTATKPSKIPLPGSKAAAYFAGKPPTGRPSTAGRSPPSVCNSTNSVNRSPLSRSTGNLMYTKSPSSLKRADSVQSVRKDNSSSLSTTSRSSTSSSIPLPTTPYICSTPKTHNAISFNNNNNNNISNNSNSNCMNSPSSRILQNSPLPKLKRESLATRVRQMDSLSRAYNNTQYQHQNHHQQQQQQQQKQKQDFLSTNMANNYVIGNTASKAATLSTILRNRDGHLNSSNSFSHGTAANAFIRRSINNKNNTTAITTAVTPTSATITTTRRFSSASVVGARVAAAARQMEATDSQQYNSNVSGGSGSAPITVTSTTSNNSNNCGSGSVSGGGGDSDSGKSNTSNKQKAQNVFDKSGLNQYFERDLIADVRTNDKMKPLINSKTLTLSQYFENLLVRDSREQIITQRYKDDIKYSQTSSTEMLNNNINNNDDDDDDGDNDEIDAYTSYNSYMSSSEAGSDNLLVTFDYGYSDSLDSDISTWQAIKNDVSYSNNSEQKRASKKSQHFMYIINEEDVKDKNATITKAHTVSQGLKYQANLKRNINHNYSDNNMNQNVNLSMLLSLSSSSSVSVSLDDYKHELPSSSGDYGSWQDDSFTINENV